MKILIAYASKSGTSRDAAEMLFHFLLESHEVYLADLDDVQPDVGDFDYVVLGGSIRAGKAHKALRRYLADHTKALCAVPHTLFLCCAFADQFENYAESTFSAELLESADDVVYFGGELNVSKQRGFDKLLARIMRNAIRNSEDDDMMLPGPLPEHVRMLADRLRGK